MWTCYGVDALNVYKDDDGDWYATDGYDGHYSDILNSDPKEGLTLEEAIQLADDKIKMYQEFKADAIKRLKKEKNATESKSDSGPRGEQGQGNLIDWVIRNR